MIRLGVHVSISGGIYKAVPLILETPKESDDDDIRNLKVVRELAGLRIEG